MYIWGQECRKKRRLISGRDDWFQSKKDAVKRHPGVWVFEKMHNEVEETLLMAEFKKKIMKKQDDLDKQRKWLIDNGLRVDVLEENEKELLDMQREYDLKAGKYGRVYIFPEKVSLVKMNLPDALTRFKLSTILHQDINGPQARLHKIEKHLAEEGYSVVSSLTSKNGMHTNIFRCMSINLYGSLEHEAFCRKKVKKYLVKAK